MSRWRDAALALALISGACGGTAVIDGEGTGGGATSGTSTSSGAGNLTCSTRFDTAQSPATYEDAFAVLASPDDGDCGNPTCHGASTGAAADFFFSNTDPVLTYVNMLSFEDEAGAPLVNEDRPDESWIHCFIRPDAGPPHRLIEQAHLVLEDWLHNGAVGP